MRQTVRKIVDILVYQSSVTEKDRKDLIRLAGEEGLFLEMNDTLPKACGPIPYYDTKACTWDGKIFYFYTDIQSEVENAMMLMGYDSHGYCLSIFKDRKEPITPKDFVWPADREESNEKET